MDLDALPLDSVEILLKLVPNEEEQKKFHQFKADKKSPESLPPNDRFIYEVYTYKALPVKCVMTILHYIQSLMHKPNNSLTHSLTHSHTHLLTHSLTHSHTHSHIYYYHTYTYKALPVK